MGLKLIYEHGGEREHAGFTNLLPVIQRLVPSRQLIRKEDDKTTTTGGTDRTNRNATINQDQTNPTREPGRTAAESTLPRHSSAAPVTIPSRLIGISNYSLPNRRFSDRSTSGAIETDGSIAERSIKAAGNVAVSTLRFVITNTAQGKVRNRFSGHVVHVWAKNEAGWKLVGTTISLFGVLRGSRPKPSQLTQASYPATRAPIARKQAQFSNDTSTSSKLPLKAITETTFTGHGNPNDEITFGRSPNGEVRECILISDGPAVRAIRVK